jgi:hypothetical protein
MQPNAFKLLKIIHLALLLGMFLMVTVPLYIVLKGMAIADESLGRTLQVVCILLSIGCVVIGFNIFKRKILAARNNAASADQRMEQYRSACITWWAMIEAPGFLAAISFMLTGNFAFYALAVVHLIILFVFTPRKGNIIVFLKLDSKDVKVLEGAA